MNDREPRLGDKVHFVPVAGRDDEGNDYASTTCLALVTGVSYYADGSVAHPALCVFSRTGFEFRDAVAYSAEGKQNSWHWPPEQED